MPERSPTEERRFVTEIHPLSLLLPTDVFLGWLDTHDPRGARIPEADEIRDALRSIPKQVRTRILARARLMVAYGQLVEEALTIEAPPRPPEVTRRGSLRTKRASPARPRSTSAQARSRPWSSKP